MKKTIVLLLSLFFVVCRDEDPDPTNITKIEKPVLLTDKESYIAFQPIRLSITDSVRIAGADFYYLFLKVNGEIQSFVKSSDFTFDSENRDLIFVLRREGHYSFGLPLASVGGENADTMYSNVFTVLPDTSSTFVTIQTDSTTYSRNSFVRYTVANHIPFPLQFPFCGLYRDLTSVDRFDSSSWHHYYYRFPCYSSGPFMKIIPVSWINIDSFFRSSYSLSLAPQGTYRIGLKYKKGYIGDSTKYVAYSNEFVVH